jgi:DNA polymerase IV
MDSCGSGGTARIHAMNVARRILLADADTFYVSVARLVDPDGAGRSPLLIVGGSAERRGVVTSASYEARRYGVHSAMPMARALRLCPNALVVPVPWEACADKSREIKAVLQRFTPAVEQASSDEFYLDMSGTEGLYGGEPLAHTARTIRAAVREATGLSVSVGGGTSCLVAKLAAGVAKPIPGTAGEGVHVVAPGDEGEFLRRFTLAELPLIGPRFQERLQRLGLRTVDDVLPHDRRALTAWLGEREGTWLWERVRGIDHGSIEPGREAKSISRDETFATDLDETAALERQLLALADRASADLREAGLLARTITVKIRDADFTTRQAGRTLPEPVISDRVVYAVARDLLARLRAARRVPARLLGVALSQLVRAEAEVQLSLLAPPPAASPSPSPDPTAETERDRVLARVIDEVRERFGPDALGRGGRR